MKGGHRNLRGKPDIEPGKTGPQGDERQDQHPLVAPRLFPDGGIPHDFVASERAVKPVIDRGQPHRLDPHLLQRER